MYKRLSHIKKSLTTILLGSIVLSVLIVGTTSIPRSAVADEESDALIALKADIHTSFTQALNSYLEENYTTEDWDYILLLKSEGDVAVDQAIDADAAVLVQGSVLTNISNVPIDLTSAKNAAHTYAAQVIALYSESDYSSGNWSNLMGCKDSADSIINTAVDMIAIRLARSDVVSCASAINPDIANARIDASATITNAYTTRLNESFAPENYTLLASYKDEGIQQLATALGQSSIDEVRLNTISRMDSVPTLAEDFATAKTAEHSVLLNIINALNPAAYTSENWNSVVAYKESGDSAIEVATTMSELSAARVQAVNAMNDVLTIARFNAIPLELSLSATSTQLSITDQNKAVALTIPLEVTNPTIDVSSFITAGTGMLPPLSFYSINLGGVRVSIASSTTVTSSNTSWNGIMNVPVETVVTLPVTNGQTKTFVSALELGFPGARLTFNRGVRILIPGQTGKRVGYATTDTDFREITNGCMSDDQAYGDSLPAETECKIDIGSDLVIWTKHFTRFATYTQVTIPTTASGRSSGGSGGGGGGGSSAPVQTTLTTTSTPTTITTTTPTPTVGRVLGASSYKFKSYLRYGITNDTVKELQEKLRSEGFFTYPTSTGYFGSVTLFAVKAFQASHNLPTSGYVGPLTVAALNK